MKSVSTLTFAALAAALPAPQTQSTEPLRFSGLALRSASPIHFGSINANSQAFWIGKNTTTYTPSQAGPGPYTTNTTLFSHSASASTLGLSTTVPGGQQVYVTAGDNATGQLAGQLKFTQAHSAATSGPALYEGFEIVDGETLKFEGEDWFACPVDEFNSGYGIWAVSRVAGSNAGANCLGFVWRVSPADDATPAAWQYTK